MTVTGAERRQPVSSFASHLEAAAAEVDAVLDALMPLPEGGERRVVEAMRYGVFNGGKRLRPFLVLHSAALFAVEWPYALRAAAALEMVHCYSLIHDDLPAMDDDDLRRGRPTVHKAYDDATAILAGDGLMSAAFEVLADPATHADAGVRADLILLLARASGPHGMVGGQMLDLAAETQDLSEFETGRMQTLKTGALFRASTEFGAVLGQASEQDRNQLRVYGAAVGAAFQIADDLLDVESSAEQTGKATGKDAAAGKATFVSLYGVERARTMAKELADQAVAALDGFGPGADILRGAAGFAIDRSA